VTILRRNAFAGPSSGTVISPTNSQDHGQNSLSVNGSPTYSNTQKHSGSLAMAIINAASPVSVEWGSLGSLTAATYVRFYVYLTAYPTTNRAYVVHFVTSTGSTGAFARIFTDGTLSLADSTNSGFGAESTAKVALNQWVRIEVMLTPGAGTGQMQWRLYNDADSSTPTETSALFTGLSVGANLNTVRFGIVTSPYPASPFTIYFDDIALGDAWIGATTTIDTRVNLESLVANLVVSDLNLADLAAITTWTDRKNGYPFVQATGTRQPVFRTNRQNGKPAAVFDGTDDFVATADAAALTVFRNKTAGTVIVVSKDTLGSASGAVTRCLVNVSITGGSNQRFSMQHRYVAAGDFRYGWQGRRLDADTSESTNTAAASTVNTAWHVETQRVNWGAATVDVRVDGTSVRSGSFATLTAGSTSDTSSRDFTVGTLSTTTPTSQPYPGEVLEVMVFDAVLTDGQVKNIEDYVYETYAIGNPPDSPAIRGVRTDSTGVSTSPATQTTTVALPDGTGATDQGAALVGDTCYLFAATQSGTTGNEVATADGTGWTALPNIPANAAPNGGRIAGWSKTLTQADITAGSVSFTVAGTQVRRAGAVVVTAPSTVEASVGSEPGTATLTSVNVPAVTAVSAGLRLGVVAAFPSSTAGGAVTHALDAVLAEIAEVSSSSPSTRNGSLVIGKEATTAAEATGASVDTVNQTVSARAWSGTITPAAATTTLTASVWNGTTEESVSVAVYNGTTEVPVTSMEVAP
jgi:hypothetical protein